MDITPPNFKNNKQGNVNDPNQVDTISLSHLGQKVDIDPKLISEACAQAARNAYKLGETDDEEGYKEDMEELITEILKEKQKKKR
ncbi:hypothetical protein DID73_00185 [Candidatus Marinamargulisbacteria bacterium SCGC AG-343-K17]|nr:hypothetical protein DID73_00185 [Candidatus Marinamargulisbacteria bacterium SCGC AG-343-K17]